MSARPTRIRLAHTRAALLIVALLSLAGASIAAAESFGKLPGPDQSRCAPLSANRVLLNIGQTIVLKAGPVTSACGGPASSTRFSWQTTDPADPADAPGLVQVHPCHVNAAECMYRARVFTQVGVYQSVGITGTSPDGGWGAGEPYAIRYGDYYGLGISINYDTGSASKVQMTGEGRNETTAANEGGGFSFDIKDTGGTYTFSFRIGSKLYHRTVTFKKGKAGSSLGVNIQAKHVFVSG